MTSIVVPASRLDRARAAMPVLALVAWTLFVWGTRVRNIVDDATLTGWTRTWSLAVAAGFTVGGLTLGALTLAWVAGDAPLAPRRLRGPAVGLAVVGAGWWAVRGIEIALDDHGVGFKVVHSVLALVTIALGVLVIRWARPSGLRP